VAHPSAPWLVYALGGGFGHLTRACALARAARPDWRVQILTNSPYSRCVRDALPEIEIIALDPAMGIDEARVEVGRQIDASGARCLIVDTFPRGLAGELVDVVARFDGATVLVQRDLNPEYSAAFDLQAFVSRSYDLVLNPGDGSVDGRDTTPWLVRSRHELLTRGGARERLGLYDKKPCVLVCAAGNPDELEWYGSVARLLDGSSRCDVRCIAPARPQLCPKACWVSYWPAMDLYAAADVVVGCAGYNTIYECLACGVPLVARPWPRKYDRQSLRAHRAASRGSVVVIESPDEAVAAVIEALALNPRVDRCAQFLNGATEAVKLIQRIASNSAA